MPVSPSIAAEWTGWLERVRSTYEAVQYTCAHRLADPGLAEQVAVQVTAGLLGRPRVFQYFGLPYSGRIARLAEGHLAAAADGRLGTACGWAELNQRLEQVPAEHREALVVICVRGGDTRSLAATLACDEATAERRAGAMLTFMHELARPGLVTKTEPEEMNQV